MKKLTSFQNLDSKNYFSNLDGLRTIACLMVFFKHGIVPAFQNLDINGTFFQKFLFFMGNGEAGVSIFFVLSGFLITYLILKEIETKGKLNVGFFYIRRVLRIWPLYYAVIIFSFVIYPIIKHYLNINSHFSYNPVYYCLFLSNFDLIHIQRFFPNQSPMFTNITWSVAIEEQFYLVWPLLFLCIPKRFFKFMFFGIFTMSMVFRLVNFRDGNVLYFHSLSACGDLALGGICAYFAFYSKSFKAFFEKLSKPTVLIVYLCGITGLIFEKELLQFDVGGFFTRLIYTLFFAFVIVEQNYCKNSLFKFSKSRLLSNWGKYTYGLYLLHPIALLVVSIGLKVLHVNYKNDFGLSLMYGIIGLFLSLVVSYLSYRYFESWFIRLKDRFTLINKESNPATPVQEQFKILVPENVYTEHVK